MFACAKVLGMTGYMVIVFSCQKVIIFLAHPPKKHCLGGRRGACPPHFHQKLALFDHLKDAKSNIWTLGKVQAIIIPNGIVYMLYQHFHKTFHFYKCPYIVNFSWHWELLDKIYAGTESVKAAN